MPIPVEQLAKDVLTETLHGPVPMETVARLAQGVIDQTLRVATLEYAIDAGLLVATNDEGGVGCLCCGAEWLDGDEGEEPHVAGCPLRSDWRPSPAVADLRARFAAKVGP